jgi:hypothetical protein
MIKALSRRSFLRGAGICLTLPLLDAMRPALASAAAVSGAAKPRRMVCIQTNMGILPQYFFPEKTGKDYELSPYLQLIEKHRGKTTVFSGISHPDVDGGHQAERCFLSAAPHPGSPAFKNSVSLDQVAAEQVGVATRFPSLALAATGESQTMSVTRTGILIPSERSPAKLYQQLFVEAKAGEVEKRVSDLKKGRSLLDFVGESSKRLQRDVGARDRDRLDQYFTSVRDLEQRMVRMEQWERKPKPKVTAPAPTDITENSLFVDKARLMLDMVRLALETDSSRVISFFLDAVPIHNITHHGNRPDTLAQLRAVEEQQFVVLNNFLNSLGEVKEDGEPLLDRTMVLYGTCMGNANSHSNHNLPVLLAGGGFRHGQHIGFDPKPGRNYPLANLYVSMLQRMGIEMDKFASSTGTMRGLEMAS